MMMKNNLTFFCYPCTTFDKFIHAWSSSCDLTLLHDLHHVIFGIFFSIFFICLSISRNDSLNLLLKISFLSFFLVWMNNETYRSREMKRRRLNQPRQNGPAKRIECEPFFEKQHHYARETWNVPCVRGVKLLFLSDSIFGSLRTEDIEKGVKVVSYGGLTLLELAFLINSGKLTIGTQELPLIKNRQRYASKELSIPFEKVCPTCKGCCYLNWKGHLLIHAGLNNLLKFTKKSFKTQNLSNLVHIVEECISRKFRQCKKVIWIIPSKPFDPQYRFNEEFCRNYQEFTRILARRTFVKHTECRLVKSNYKSDLLHLDEKFCRQYFFDIWELYKSL